MSFKPEGFTRKAYTPGSGQNNRTQRPRDYLVEVVDYDLANKTMIARNVEDGQSSVVDIEVSIAPDAVARQSKKASKTNDPTRFVGYLIDDRMSAKIRPGQRVVLEGCVAQRRVQKGDKTYSRFEAQWISGVPDARPEKAFRGITTLEAYENRVSNVQVWEPRGLDTTANYDDILTYLGRMDETVAAHAREEHPANLGVQMRALIQKGTTSAKVDGQDKEVPVYEVIDTTGAFAWMSAKRDAQGTITEKGRPLGKDDAVELISGYTEYLQDKFKDQPDVAYRVEVMPFREYRASQQSNKMVIHEKSPLSDMANAETRCSPGDTEVVRGKNFAVNGIVILSKDQAPTNPGEQWKTRNLVQDIFTNGYRGHVCNLVWAFDGGRVQVHPELDRVNRPTYTGASQAPQQDSQAPADSGFGEAPAADAFGGDVFGGTDQGVDVFAQAISAQGGAAAPAAEQPAATPAAEPAAEQPAASPPAGGNLFSRPRQV